MKARASFLVALFATVGWAEGDLPPGVYGPVSTEPIVLAKSALVMDAVTGKILWSRDPDTKRYPASTTKIMTALLTLESLDRSRKLTAPKDIGRVGGSSLYLKPFEQISVDDALYAMMLRSANDVCHTVAIELGGSLLGFAQKMNDRAREIGCTNTHFTNPHGLPDTGHVTTARDLALIGREAMRNADFREIAKTQQREISRPLNKKEALLINRNRWLAKDPTADGIKTGFTRAAGLTYVGSAVRDGFRVITVVLNTENWQHDHKSMLDWAFANYEVGLRAEGEQVMGRVPIAGAASPTVPVISEVPVQMLAQREPAEDLHLEWDSKVPPTLPIKTGQKLGQVVIRDRDGFSVKVPVRAAADVAAARRPLNSTFGQASGYILGGAMLCGAWVMRRKSRIA